MNFMQPYSVRNEPVSTAACIRNDYLRNRQHPRGSEVNAKSEADDADAGPFRMTHQVKSENTIFGNFITLR